MKILKACGAVAVLALSAGCNLESPAVGQSAEAAYGTATVQGSAPGGSPTRDVQSLQSNRANDAQVINDAQKALGQR